MGLADQFREAWDRMTGKPEPQPRHEAKPPPLREAPPTHEDIRRARGKEPGPAERAMPRHAENLREAAKHKPPPAPPAPKPVEREATKMAYTRTPQPGPTPGGMGSTFVNPTSTFAKQQEAKAATEKAAPDQTDKKQGAPPGPKLADWRRSDSQAAEKQQAADKAKAPEGASKLASFRRPGQAPDNNPDRARAEQRMVDQFKQQFRGQEQERSR